MAPGKNTGEATLSKRPLGLGFGRQKNLNGRALVAALAVVGLFNCAVDDAGADVTDAPGTAGTVGGAALKSTDLMVAEASSGAVKITSGTPAVAVKLNIVNTTNRPINGIVARLSPFIDGAGSTSMPSLVGAAGPAASPFTLDAYSARSLQLAVDLPKPGVHVARLWLGAGSAAMVTAIEISRTDKAPALTIGNLLPVTVPLAWGTTTSPTQNLPVTLNGGAKELTLPLPQLTVLYKPDDKVSLAAPDVKLAAQLVKPAAAPAYSIKLDASGRGVIPIAFTGFPSAGRYEATLTFAPSASAPESRSVLLYVREGGLTAALWIAFGVCVAFLLRIYGTVLAPRLALETRAAALFSQLRDARATARANDEAGVSVADAVRDALTARWNSLATSARLIGSTDLDIYDAKIPLLRDWLQLRVWLDQGLPPHTQALAREVLAAAELVLRNPAATAAEVLAQAAALASLPGRLDQLARTELRTAVDELEKALRGSVEQQLSDLHAEARKLRDTMQNSAGSINDFAKSLNELRLERARFLISDLRDLLAKAGPSLIPAPQWQALTLGSKRLLDAAAADADSQIAAYSQALAIVASPIATVVSSQADEAIAAGSAQAPGWEQVRANAQRVLAGIAADPPTGSPADLDRLLTDSEALRQADEAALAQAAATAPGSPGVQAQALPAALNINALITGPGASAGAGWMNFVGYGPDASKLAGPDALRNARLREFALSSIALGLIAGLAILAGVKALWANDWAWGGATAYLVAFLWGAGLTGFTFDGVKNLITKVG